MHERGRQNARTGKKQSPCATYRRGPPLSGRLVRCSDLKLRLNGKQNGCAMPVRAALPEPDSAPRPGPAPPLHVKADNSETPTGGTGENGKR